MKIYQTKIAKNIALTVFFMAMFLNVKLNLEDPFIQISSAVIAQTSSSSMGCDNPGLRNCNATIDTRVGDATRFCGSCTLVPNSTGVGIETMCTGC